MTAENSVAVELVLNQARDVLDSFDVPGRLLHVRNFVWRGGELHLRTAPSVSAVSAGKDVYYELRAEWDAPVLAEVAARPGLAAARSAVVEGQWMRGQTGYVLRLGIDSAVPSAIYIRAGRILASIPFAQRPPAQVESALAADLAAYVDRFLNRCLPVPQARANAAAKLAALRLTPPPATGTD